MTDNKNSQNIQAVSTSHNEIAVSPPANQQLSGVWDLDLWTEIQKTYEEKGLAGLMQYCPKLIDSSFQCSGESNIYVDKTGILLKLSFMHNVFLARPRRMGKTTTVSTLAAMSHAAYLQSIASDYSLPDVFKNTAFANATFDEKEFLCAPYVVRISFINSYFDLSLLKDLVATNDQHAKQIAELTAQKEAELSTLTETYEREAAQIKQQMDKRTQEYQLKLQEFEQRLITDIEQLEQLKQQQLNSLDPANLEEFASLSLLINQRHQSSLDLSRDSYKSSVDFELFLYKTTHTQLQEKLAQLKADYDADVARLNSYSQSMLELSENGNLQEFKSLQLADGEKQLNILSNTVKVHIHGLIDTLHNLAHRYSLNIEPLSNTYSVDDLVVSEKVFINCLLVKLFVQRCVDALVANIEDMQKIQRPDLAHQSCECLEKVINEVCAKLQSAQLISISDIVHAVLSNLPAKSVVLLIDEYDTPITGCLEFKGLCQTVMQCMRDFYDLIKDAAGVIKFCFVTGITNYAKLSMFSGANQFCNISYEQRFAAIVGFTEDELKRYLSPAIYRMAIISKTTPQDCLNRIMDYYNGYCFALTTCPDLDYRSISIMNPISIRSYLIEDDAEFNNYWIDTGSNVSKFVQTLLHKSDNDDLTEVIDLATNHQLLVDSVSFYEPQVLSLENIKTSLPIFLLQSGYLTLDWDKNLSHGQSGLYCKLPNQEIKNYFARSIMPLGYSS